MRMIQVCGSVLVVLILAACGGSGRKSSAPVAPAKAKEEEKAKTVEIFTANRDIACATSPKFLDSSPLASPANFAIVRAGTEVVQVGFGGVTSRMYYELSAGGEARIYVYRDIFEQRFSARTLTIKPKSQLDREAKERAAEESAAREREAERARQEAKEREQAEKAAKIKKMEPSAAANLAFAKKLLASGKPADREKAITRLREIVAEFPGTEAAKEGQGLLDKMK